MKTNIRLLQKRRVFSEEFKQSVVKGFESGRLYVYQLLCSANGDMHPLQSCSGGVSVRLLGDMRFHVLGNVNITGTCVRKDDALLIKVLFDQLDHCA